MNQWPYRIFPKYGTLCPRCNYHMMADDDGSTFCYNAMCKAFNQQLNDKFMKAEK